MRLPSRSVIEIIVLLKEAATWAIPTGTFFFSFLRKTFFFPVAFAISLSVVSGQRQWTAWFTTDHGQRAIDYFYFLPGAFFLAIVARLGPFRVRALVCVR